MNDQDTNVANDPGRCGLGCCDSSCCEPGCCELAAEQSAGCGCGCC